MESKQGIIERFEGFNAQLKKLKETKLSKIATIDEDGKFIKNGDKYYLKNEPQNLRENALDFLKLDDLILLNENYLKILRFLKNLNY